MNNEKPIGIGVITETVQCSDGCVLTEDEQVKVYDATNRYNSLGEKVGVSYYVKTERGRKLHLIEDTYIKIKGNTI